MHTVQSPADPIPHAQYLFHPLTFPGLPAPFLLVQDYLLYHILDANAGAAIDVYALVVVVVVDIDVRVTDWHGSLMEDAILERNVLLVLIL